MAFNFGSMFKDMLGGATGGAAGAKSTPIDTKGIDKLTIGLTNLSKKTKEAMKAMKEAATTASEAEADYGRGSRAHVLALAELSKAESRVTNLSAAESKVKGLLSKETEDLIDIETKAITGGKKYSKSITQINDDYTKGVKKILENTKLTAKKREEELDKIKKTAMAEKMSAMWTDTEGAVKAGADGISTVITDAISSIAPELALILPIVEQSIGAAFKQVLELNDSLIKLQRATGGMITASRLGYDQFGNSARGMMSLKTATIAANVSIGEFDNAMASLAQGGFGQTIGTTQDLSKAQEDLSKYGIEAARSMKLYGADLGPSVRNLFQNFGKGIGEATTMLKNGAGKARQLGLTAAAFIKNFESVTDLVGEVYFSTTEQMQKMATIATQLGVSVGTMSKGLIKMNGITDLFAQQQKMAALGLDTTAKALSKIYALKQQGKGGDAAKVAFAAMAKDMQKQGMTKGGQVTQQGIATLEAAGVEKDAIAGIQKMAMQAEKTGIDVGKLGDISKLTKMQQLKLAHEEAANMTLEEQFYQITGLFKQSFIDPLASIFGPIMKGLLNVVKPLAEIFNTVISTIMSLVSVALDPLIEVFTQVTDFLSDIFTPLSGLFSTLKTSMMPIFDMLKQLGLFIVKFGMVPFRMIGRVIGGVFDVISKVVKVISDALAPAFNWLADLFKGGGGMISDMLDGITAAFGWLGDLLGGAFSMLGKTLGGVVQVFKRLWSGVKKVWDVLNDYFIKPISTVLGPVFSFLGDVIDDLMAPFKWLWEQLKAFGDWLEKWFGSSKAEDAASYATDWTDVLGKAGAAEMATPTTPTANTGNQFVAAPSKTIGEANSNQNFIQGSNPAVKNNITINTNVDGIISNVNSIKKTA